MDWLIWILKAILPWLLKQGFLWLLHRYVKDPNARLLMSNLHDQHMPRVPPKPSKSVTPPTSLR
jgi:hypothetical protein